VRACPTEVGRILTRKGITSSPNTGIDATSVVDVPVVTSLKLEKRNFGGDVLALPVLPRHSMPIDWSGLSCLSARSSHHWFYPSTSISTHSLLFISILPASLCSDWAWRPLKFTPRYYTHLQDPPHPTRAGTSTC